MANNQPPKVFHLGFMTGEVKKTGYIRATKITIEEDVIGLDETVRIDLADHPHYKDLQAYVLANPR